MADTKVHQTTFKTNLGQEIQCGIVGGYPSQPEIPDGCYVISITSNEYHEFDSIKFSYICYDDLDEIGEIDHIYIRDQAPARLRLGEIIDFGHGLDCIYTAHFSLRYHNGTHENSTEVMSHFFSNFKNETNVTNPYYESYDYRGNFLVPMNLPNSSFYDFMKNNTELWK